MRPYVLLHPMDTSNHCNLCVYGCFFTQSYNLIGGEGLAGAGTEALIILDELITLPALPNLLVSQGYEHGLAGSSVGVNAALLALVANLVMYVVAGLATIVGLARAVFEHRV
jgi:hypothetical protein